MSDSNSSKLISYFLFLGFLFFVLFALDSIFNLKYEPEEHSINQPKQEHVSSGHDHHDTPAVTEEITGEETTEKATSEEEVTAEEPAHSGH